MQKISYFLIMYVALSLLQGCGGDENPNPWPVPPLEGSTGSVTTYFVPTDARYFFRSDKRGSIRTVEFIGAPVSYVQEDNGAVTQIVNSSGTLSIAAPADNQLSINGTQLPDAQEVYFPIIKEISGDAYFAMGRWAVGSATNIDETGLLYVEYPSSFTGHYLYISGIHYLLMNKIPVFPAAGILSCDSGSFTQGTFYDGTRPVSYKPVTITGDASLYFNDTGAHFSIDLHASMTHLNSAVSGDQAYAGSITSPSTISYPNGSAVMVGEGGSGSYLLGGRYTITSDVGTIYHGVMLFRCQEVQEIKISDSLKT